MPPTAPYPDDLCTDNPTSRLDNGPPTDHPTPMRFSLALLWLLISCSSLVRSEDPESGSVTKTGLDTYMDQPLLGGCEDARERLWIEPNGDLHWVVEHRSGFWERVTGTWTREPGGVLSHRLLISGTRASLVEGQRYPAVSPWTGTVHLTAMTDLPAIAFREEAKHWTHLCLNETVDINKVWGEARGQRGLALTGSLEGVFLPSGS
jgi:hypothetical protein